MNLLVVVALGLLGWWLWWEMVGKRKGLPPSLRPLPFLGNLHQMDPAVGRTSPYAISAYQVPLIRTKRGRWRVCEPSSGTPSRSGSGTSPT